MKDVLALVELLLYVDVTACLHSLFIGGLLASQLLLVWRVTACDVAPDTTAVELCMCRYC
jgi:hypothetical protein